MRLPFVTDREQALVGEPAVEDPYLPFHAALERGILGDLAELAKPAANPPGVDLANGVIPNSKGAGIVELNNGDLIAFDHAAIEMEGDNVNVLPAAKEAVDEEGRITYEGAILMGTPSGILQVFARAVHTVRNPWTAERLRVGRPRKTPMREITVFFGETREFEVKDVDGKTGIVKAKPRRLLF